jgi:AraC-like DNA-binding protein
VDSTCADIAKCLEEQRRGLRVCCRDLEHAPRWISDPSLAHLSVLVIGSHDRNGDLSTRRVELVRAHFPQLTILVRVRQHDLCLAHRRQFAVAGADDVCDIDSSGDAARAASDIRRRWLAPVPASLIRETATVLPEGEGRTIALWCLRNSYCRRTVDDVARRFCIDRKTALRRCRESGAPALTVLLRLGRLYHATELRRTSFLSQDEIARRLGYSNAVALVMSRARARRAALTLGMAVAAGAAPPWQLAPTSPA